MQTWPSHELIKKVLNPQSRWGGGSHVISYSQEYLLLQGLCMNVQYCNSIHALRRPCFCCHSYKWIISLLIHFMVKWQIQVPPNVVCGTLSTMTEADVPLFLCMPLTYTLFWSLQDWTEESWEGSQVQEHHRIYLQFSPIRHEWGTNGRWCSVWYEQQQVKLHPKELSMKVKSVDVSSVSELRHLNKRLNELPSQLSAPELKPCITSEDLQQQEPTWRERLPGFQTARSLCGHQMQAWGSCSLWASPFTSVCHSLSVGTRNHRTQWRCSCCSFPISTHFSCWLFAEIFSISANIKTHKQQNYYFIMIFLCWVIIFLSCFLYLLLKVMCMLVG